MSKIDIEESRPVRWFLAACDAVLLAMCLLGSYMFYEHSNPSVNMDVDIQTYIVVALMCYIPVWMIYPPMLLQRTVRGDKVVARAFQMALLHVILFFSVLFMLKHVAIARTLLLTFAIVFWLLLVAERLLILNVVRRFRVKGKNVQYAILVGHIGEMRDLYDHMQNKEYGFKVLGFFSDEKAAIEGLPKLGGVVDVMHYLQENPHVNGVYCTMAHMSREEIVELYRYCENNLVRFYALPMYVSFLRRNMRISHVGSTVLLTPRREPLRDWGNRMLKRALDLLISGLFLVTLFPIIYVIVAIIIKRQSPGPVIFAQRRNGMNGDVFFCYKFRSMHVNAQADTQQASEHDVRKFPFGDLMRRTSIDELPQFVNVFLGDMSVVGPRPHMLLHTEEYSHIINRYMVRHWVKPGITGWAQVNGFRGETKELEQMEKRVHADIWYIENWTFWLDIRIIWRTFINTFLHHDENAY